MAQRTPSCAAPREPEKDREIAREKYHLTARQAGAIARQAGAKQVTVFHFSPRYSGSGDLLAREALEAYEGAGEAALSDADP